MEEILEFIQEIKEYVVDINLTGKELRKDSDLKTARNFVIENYIRLVNDCYEFKDTLNDEDRKNFDKKLCLCLDFSETRILVIENESKILKGD